MGCGASQLLAFPSVKENRKGAMGALSVTVVGATGLTGELSVHLKMSKGFTMMESGSTSRVNVGESGMHRWNHTFNLQIDHRFHKLCFLLRDPKDNLVRKLELTASQIYRNAELDEQFALEGGGEMHLRWNFTKGKMPLQEVGDICGLGSPAALLFGFAWEGRKKLKKPDVDVRAFAITKTGITLGTVNSRRTEAFKNPEKQSAALRHSGAHKRGKGVGDDDEIYVDITAIPKEAFAVVITVKSSSGTPFGKMMKSAVVRVRDCTGNMLCVNRMCDTFRSATTSHCFLVAIHRVSSGGWAHCTLLKSGEAVKGGFHTTFQTSESDTVKVTLDL
mmetsp:Transcript_15348/g.36244  ORF Transcript_15348/g.36244 Transcript_15348/m.36244 type:complete len:333 (+) Transcript_15348:32-1030(+)